MAMDDTNKNLLENAARAAGDPVDGWTADADFVPIAILRSGARWQPLLNNRLTDCMGDALRLAVTLKLEVYIHEHDTRAVDGNLISSSSEPHGTDPYSATRRAIVRAAAAIGEKL